MKFFKKRVPTKDELYIRDIIDKYSENPKIKKYIISNGVYMIDNDNSIHISIENSKIRISNHKFLYEKNFPLTYIESQVNRVKKAVDKEVSESISEVFSNEVDLLRKIFNTND